MTELEPHVLITLEDSGHRVSFAVESASGQFRVYTSCTELMELPEVETVLCHEATFAKEDGKLARLVPRAEIHDLLQQVAQSLANLPS